MLPYHTYKDTNQYAVLAVQTKSGVIAYTIDAGNVFEAIGYFYLNGTDFAAFEKWMTFNYRFEDHKCCTHPENQRMEFADIAAVHALFEQLTGEDSKADYPLWLVAYLDLDNSKFSTYILDLDNELPVDAPPILVTHSDIYEYYKAMSQFSYNGFVQPRIIEHILNMGGIVVDTISKTLVDSVLVEETASALFNGSHIYVKYCFICKGSECSCTPVSRKEYAKTINILPF